MTPLANSWPVIAWIAGSVLFFILAIWIAVRMIRWARRGTKGTALFGMALEIPAAGINPQPPPRFHIQELENEIQGKKSAESDGSPDPESKRPS